MKVFTSVNDPEIARILQAGGIGVLRTDTLYGMVACASNEAAVERVYDVKDRDSTKSPIVLISDVSQLFDEPTEQERSYFEQVWPGKVSIILPSTKAPRWITRENASVAYRLPDEAALNALIRETGPLVAPSANPQAQEPALNVGQAQNYFGESVDFYIDGGQVTDNSPSQLIRITGGEIERLR